MNAQAHPAFEFLRSERIESLNLDVSEFRHIDTGAQHIHISADNQENVFLVALRTVPQDSRGVAHILEHTALCGSEKYPVRDPFFMMIRRSLNTFMNAFTSSDWTAYPFASQNKKDFNNLLDVYLDAVFFSRLDVLDFAQEGHRLEFADPDNISSDLVYKGVVFNEMKGAMSSVPSTLWHTLCKYLYPTTTYHFNSGGDPEHIPDLTYEQLVNFYRNHYHPSNAIFMTFGDIAATEHQARFEEHVFARFERLDKIIAVNDEKRYLAPLNVEEAYALDEPGPTEEKTHIVIGWLLGKATDLQACMQAHLLSSVLLDNSASPLRKLLETTELGSSPSPLCGVEDSQREMCFVCGIEGSEPEHAARFESQVLDVLKDVAENGVAYEQVEAALHQLELRQREIGGDTYPYGLQLILTALTSATHRGDPIALLDLEPVLADMRQAIKDPDYIKRLAGEMLLNNQHRVRLTMHPDQQLSARREAAEKAALTRIVTTLSEPEKTAIQQQARALMTRQQQKDDESILPKVTLDDVAPELAYKAAEDKTTTPLTVTSYAVGSNGLVYQQVIAPLPPLSDEQIALLPIYADCLTEVGTGDRDYLATQMRQSQICGALSAYASTKSQPDDVQTLDGYFVLSTKGLNGNQAALCDLLKETLDEVHFDELPRLRELVAQMRAHRESSVTGNGHSLAMAAATAGLSPGGRLAHDWNGLGGIRHIKSLDKSLDDDAELEALAARLREIHQLVAGMPREFLLIGEGEHLAGFRQTMYDRLKSPEHASKARFSLSAPCHSIRQIWQTSTQVNFCAQAYPTVAMDHPDAAPLNVLGGFLRNGYLHRAIREQGGAYGGGAGHDSSIGAFRFFSYRDPRTEGTLSDFKDSIAWLKREKHEWQQVEEAILGVVSSIDKPASPAGEAKATFHAELAGRTREKRELFRNRVRAVKLDDLVRVADTYLREDQCSTAIVTDPETVGELAHLNMEHCVL